MAITDVCNVALALSLFELDKVHVVMGRLPSFAHLGFLLNRERLRRFSGSMQSPRVESKRSVGAPSARWRPVLQPLVQRAAILSPAGRAVSFSQDPGSLHVRSWTAFSSSSAVDADKQSFFSVSSVAVVRFSTFSDLLRLSTFVYFC